MRNSTAAALLSLLLFGCAVAPPGGAAPANGLPDSAAAAYPQRVAELLAEANRVRVAASLQPLTAMPQLTGVGIARDAAGEWYVVQLYVLPRSGR